MYESNFCLGRIRQRPQKPTVAFSLISSAYLPSEVNGCLSIFQGLRKREMEIERELMLAGGDRRSICRMGETDSCWLCETELPVYVSQLLTFVGQGHTGTRPRLAENYCRGPSTLLESV